MAHRRDQDHYGRKAKKEGFAARSVYKLEQIQQRFRILERGYRVVDLGCSPGSWLQLATRLVGESGHLLGIDLKVMKVPLPGHVEFLQGSVLSLDRGVIEERLGGKIDVLLSDMAPSTSGVRLVDQLRAEELSRTALEWSAALLRPGGRAVIKVFQGPGTKELMEEARLIFAKVRTFKPPGSRSESMETFLVATGFRKG